MSGRAGAGYALRDTPEKKRAWRDGISDPAETLHHGGSFKTYFAHKNLKLQEQFEAQALHQNKISCVFRGVCIHVNGYTVPGHQELKQLMALHGGRFETYFHRDRVTHIVCAHLPDTKLKHLAHERNPLPIVHPDWVVASIRAGQLLPVKDFQLERVSKAPGQRRLADYAQHAAPALGAGDIFPNLQPAADGEPGADGDAFEGDAPREAGEVQLQRPGEQEGVPPSQQLEGVHRQQQQQQQQPQPQPRQQQLLASGAAVVAAHQALPMAQAAPLAGSPQPGAVPPALTGGSTCHGEGGRVPVLPVISGGVQQAEQQAVQQGPPDQPDELPACALPCGPPAPEQAAGAAQPPVDYSGPEGLALAQQTAARLRAACDVLKGRPRTSRDDPSFLTTFFRSSRLHFIGTWRSRIEPLITAMEQQAPAPRRVVPAGGITRAFAAAPVRAGHAQPPPPRERAIIHLDMDCFFASVAAVGRPEFAGRPLAVCHSNSAQGSGEVSCVNYEARHFGIAAGMRIAEAKRRCPDLLVVPYEFEKYTDITEQVYRILLRHSSCVQPLSCDEAYVDVTGLGDPEAIAAAIRAEVAVTTHCTASAGIGPNLLLARLATKHAKPNGQQHLRQRNAQAFLADLPVSSLPGVGYTLRERLQEMGITQVRQVWAASKENLCRKLGRSTGLHLWNYAHGEDERPVETPKARKSVGAEVNWGVRFDTDAAAHAFLGELSGELAARLAEAGVKGRCLTLKLKRRQEGAPEPGKFLGMGICDSLSRSVTLGRYIATQQDIAAEAGPLLTAMQIPCQDLRGIGLQMSKLDTDAASKDARPSAPAPSKLPAPKPTVYQPSARHTWFTAPPSGAATPSAPSGATAITDAGGSDGGGAGPARDGGRAMPPATSKRQFYELNGPAVERQPSSRPGRPAGWEEAGGVAADQSAGGGRGTGAAGAGADHVPPPSPPAQSPQPPQCQQREQPGPSRRQQACHLVRTAVAAGGQRRSPEISAMPPVSELDQGVLDALPLALRKELERAYGTTFRGVGAEHAAQAKRTADAAPAAKRRRTVHAAPAAKRAGRSRGAPGSRGSSPVAASPPTKRPAEAFGPAAAMPLSYSQVDPSVLHQLPPEVQREVLAALPGGKGRPAAASGALHAGHKAMAGEQHRPPAGPGLRKVVGAGPPSNRAEGHGAPRLVVFAAEPWQRVQEALGAVLEVFTAESGYAGGAAAGGAAAGGDASVQPLPSQQQQAGAADAKLAIVAELLLQWLLGRDDDLELLLRCLQWVQREGDARRAFARHAVALQQALQAHVQRQYGFKLRTAALSLLRGREGRSA